KGVLLRPLPFAHADRLVGIAEGSPQRGISRLPITAAAFSAYRDRSGVFEDAGAATDWLPSLTGSGEPESLFAYRFSGNMFSVLGLTPRLGRMLRPDDAHASSDKVTVLSDRLWKRKFGSDPSIVGR